MPNLKVSLHSKLLLSNNFVLLKKVLNSYHEPSTVLDNVWNAKEVEGIAHKS